MALIIKNKVVYGGVGGGDNSVDLTMAEYKALEAAGTVMSDTTYYITDAVNDQYNASSVVFDDTNTQLGAVNVQVAIEKTNDDINELNSNMNIIDEAISKLSEDIATKASAIKEKASGETIVVTDSDEKKPLGLAIDGKSEQNQYSGKNLYPYGDLSGNGGILTEKPLVLPIGTYKFSMKTNVSSNIVTTIGFLDENKKNVTSIGLANSHWTTRNSITVNITSESKYISVYAREEITLSQIQIESGSEMTDYEPYCGGIPSPNQSYPQEIRNIGVYDESSGKYAVEVKCIGKNHFNYVTCENKTYSEKGEVSIQYNRLVSDYISVKARTYKTIFPVGIQLIGYVLFDKNYNFVERIIYDDKTGKQSHTFANECFVRLYFKEVNNKSITNETMKTTMFTLDESDDTYEPYKETTATVYLDEPLRKGDKAYWNGEKMLVERNRVVTVFDGSDDEGWEQLGAEYGIRFSIKMAGHKISDTTNGVTSLNTHAVAGFVGSTYSKPNTYTITENAFIIGIENMTSINAFRTYLSENPITLEYTLSEPITEEIDIDLGELTMFYPTTILSNDCNANMEVEYIADTKAYIDKKFAELATAML